MRLKQWLSVVVVGTAIIFFTAVAQPTSAATCSPTIEFTTGCATVTPSVGNGGVDLGGSIDTPGSPRADRPRGGGGGAGAEEAEAPCIRVCRDGFTVTTPTDGRGPITLADLVNFRPEVGVQRMEPSGWMVVGLDTNFYVETGAHVEDGLLLGLPASVRFTPVAYHWDYGDGTSAHLATKGASWRALGLREFDPTPTSHVFSTPGAYAISVSVEFRAEYSFGDGAWTAVDGTVPVPSAPMNARAGDADTVLVAGDCASSPRGPGC